MKTLLVLRHAKSSWSDPTVDDHERPLNKRGRRDAPRMGELVRQHGLIPGMVISSDAMRARLTAEAVAEAACYAGEILLSRLSRRLSRRSIRGAISNCRSEARSRVSGGLRI